MRATPIRNPKLDDHQIVVFGQRRRPLRADCTDLPGPSGPEADLEALVAWGYGSCSQNTTNINCNCDQIQPPYKEWRPDLNQRKCLSSELGQPVSPDDFPELLSRDERRVWARGHWKWQILQQRETCLINGNCDIQAARSIIFPIRREAP